MNVEHLVTMANQIGAFFESQPDRNEAVAGVADHLRRFWDPRMRRAIVAHVQGGHNDLKQIVADAVKVLAAEQAERKN
ncbi:MAG: formate dehydrogenase subunit delta [Gammaproteobacteria bacterium]|nr:formate dehydrogenase subunit delta [Gammaproteobacteria bacterium]